jgi:hypothetical protein
VQPEGIIQDEVAPHDNSHALSLMLVSMAVCVIGFCLGIYEGFMKKSYCLAVDIYKILSIA